MKKYTVYPYVVWSLLFIVFPLFLIIYFSISKSNTGHPFTIDNYKRLMNPIYLKMLLRSIKLALISTGICLALGYPLAIILANIKGDKRNILVLLLLMPMWMNFLLRTYAWMAILAKHGFINTLLRKLGLPPLNLLYNDKAILLGMVYDFLPFMVLPIYTVLIKIDKNLIEAARDLGATNWKVFIKIILPLSVPGIMSGVTMVFMPAVTTFVISKLLGGEKYNLIGNLIEQQFLTVGDWNFGSAVAILMMLIILVSMRILSKYHNKEEGGSGLW